MTFSAVPELTVACVCVPPKYEYGHVTRLHNMVKRHLRQPFLFYSLLDSTFPGYWAKIELFKPGRFHGRVLYLDLDVTVVGNLDDLVDLPASFNIIEDFQFKKTKNSKRWGKFNSSVMVWDAGIADHVYTSFRRSEMQRLKGGDQAWIGEKVPWANTFPRAWCRSYKWDVKPLLDGKVPKDCRVVVFHGKPKPWEVEADWNVS